MKLPNLTFLGIGSGSPEEILRGKRRAVAYIAFFVFIFLVAAADSPDWVKGVMEIDVTPTVSSVLAQNPVTCADCLLSPLAASPLSADLVVTITPTFHLSLTSYETRGEAFSRAVNRVYERSCSVPLDVELDTLNSMIQNATSSSPFYGIKPFSIKTFKDTFGLLVWDAILQAVMYVAIVCICYEVAVVTNHRLFEKVVKGLSVGVIFFTFVPMVLFAASSVKSSFCALFDPDTGLNGTFCNYSSGFNLNVVSFVFSLLQAVLVFKWLPFEESTGTYSFGQKSADIGSSDIGSQAISSGTAPAMGNSYQDFGSA